MSSDVEDALREIDALIASGSLPPLSHNWRFLIEKDWEAVSSELQDLDLEKIEAALPWLLRLLLLHVDHPHFDGSLFAFVSAVEARRLDALVERLNGYRFPEAQRALHKALNALIVRELPSDDCCEHVFGLVVLKRLLCS